MARQNLITVVSDVPQSCASSVMVELATPSGSSMTLVATRRSAGGREGSNERTRTTVLSGGAPPVTSEVPAPVCDAPPGAGSCPAGFLMAESFLQGKYHVNAERATVTV